MVKALWLRGKPWKLNVAKHALATNEYDLWGTVVK